MDSSGSLLNDETVLTNNNANVPEEEDVDPIWLSSRTARQIYGLCQVEKVSTTPFCTRMEHTSEMNHLAGRISVADDLLLFNPHCF